MVKTQVLHFSAVPRHHLGRVVGATVISHYNLQRLESLCQQALNRPRQEPGVVVGGYEGGDGHLEG